MKKTALFVLFLVFLIANQAYAEDKGKIAVAAEGNTATAEVSGVAARTPYYLFFDGAGNLLEAVDNPYKEAKRGAGSSVVPFLAQKGVTLVVAGEFGKNMIQAMKSQGIEYLEFHGNAEGALNKVLEIRK